MKKKPFLHDKTPFLKLIMLGIIVLSCTIFTLMIGVLLAFPIFGSNILQSLSNLANSTSPEIIAIGKYMQIISQLGMFVIPSLIFAFLANRSIGGFFKLKVKPKTITILLSVILTIAAIPLINKMIEINSFLRLPEFMSGIENWMKASEKDAGKMTQLFLNVNTTSGLLLNLFMIAVIPAFGEEFLFRGIILRIFHEWSKNIHAAIIFSAMLFSAFHMQFYGFLPRMMMGILFGYLFYWSGTLWVPIIAHFINNAIAVVGVYLTFNGTANLNLDNLGTGSSGVMMDFVSLILVTGIILLIYIVEKNKRRIEMKEV
ncbi:MAG: CPBP family intramembrane metalloprotease [Bacteroidetes bacterium]|nr:CPBP family intramembrane metalloprotease [Bacteroidota bacterium]